MAFWIPALAGAAGMMGGMFLGDTKKGQTETHAAYEHYAPVTTDARALTKTFAPTTIYQIESPFAQASGAKVRQEATSSPDIRPQRTETMTEGMDMTKIAIIGVVGLIAYGVVSKK